MKSQPVWHKPAWVTAIVALVSAFLTVPQVIGDFLVSGQEVDAAKISNKVAQQQQEFVVVKEVLEQKGPDRITFLRYLVATLKEADARDWAAAEVERLDKISKRELDKTQLNKKVKQLQSDINKLSSANENANELREELGRAQKDLKEREKEISLLRASAGVSVNERHPYIGGFWTVGNGSKYWINQSGGDGEELSISDQLGKLIATGEFDGADSFWLVFQGSALRHGTVSSQGTRITWRRGGFVWSRTIPKSDD